MWSLNTNKKPIKYRLNNSSKNRCNFFYYVNIGLCIGTDKKLTCLDQQKNRRIWINAYMMVDGKITTIKGVPIRQMISLNFELIH
jgi:hypothetical protein